MKKLNLSIIVFAMIVIVSVAIFACNSTKSNADGSSTKTATAKLDATRPDTMVNGIVTFVERNGKVKMNLLITVPSKASSSVAVHIHENGDCGDMGKAAGGHWNPTNKKHGKWGQGDYHSGDIGNIKLDAGGKGSMQLETDLWSIGGPATTNILSKSIIVHSGIDDFTSQPAGNAGSRIGCGVIMQKM